MTALQAVALPLDHRTTAREPRRPSSLTSSRRESNPRPRDYESHALTTELHDGLHFLLLVTGSLGWPTGIDPASRGPQPRVLPLDDGHHEQWLYTEARDHTGQARVST